MIGVRNIILPIVYYSKLNINLYNILYLVSKLLSLNEEKVNKTPGKETIKFTLESLPNSNKTNDRAILQLIKSYISRHSHETLRRNSHADKYCSKK